MAQVRIATFNAENLFARYKFNANVDPVKAVQNGWKADQRYFDISDPKEKEITGKTIKGLNADVVALQEIENLDTLKRFRDLYLGGRKAYPYAVMVDGNDPRLIDVAVLSRLPLVHVRSYQHFWVDAWKYYLFSRDCLEVDVQLPDDSTITLFVNHLKSMMDNKHPCDGRAQTREKRQTQAAKVKEIVTQRFGPNAADHPFIVLGDFNDYLDTDAQGQTGIDQLVLWDQVENVVNRLPAEERWTHFFKGNKKCKIGPSYHQLDYLLVSKSLANKNGNAPYIERRGLAKRADRYKGPHFPGVGNDAPKASDHCPVVMELSI
ncbi:MAG: endonuclease/exonuclease/phosphatase family protein [Candidatus Zixiibacteriota bacterium]